MFNFQGSELMIILLLALVVLGPEKLPEAMRKLGRFYADLKKMSSGFQQEFRAAVEEPTRELRETANTLRDSLDFRKLQDGDRPEKPKSAEMTDAGPADAGLAPADPDAGPTDAGSADAGLAPADPDAVPTEDVPFQPASVPPTPPPPFSGSQASSAAPRTPAAADAGNHGRDDEQAASRTAPQVAVDDEHGLREARPAEQDGAA